MVGRSGCGLSINLKYVGEEMNAAKYSGYFPARNAVVMSKIEARSVWATMRGCSSPPATSKSKKITSKLGLGLNFAVNVDFLVLQRCFQ